jgi:urocanate hydratase
MRQAMREGTIDFLVTSLEEALRILKNEVRKQQPIAVGVAVPSEQLVKQMLTHGVLPDLLPPVGWGIDRTGMNESAETCFQGWGSQRLVVPQKEDQRFAAWAVDRGPSVWLPRLDRIAMSVIPQEDLLRRRWLRLAPQYLGRTAMQRRGVALSHEELERFQSEALALVVNREAAGEEPARVTIDAGS